MPVKTMPSEVGYEWSGLTLQEKKSEGQAVIIFGMAVLFVFLLLSASLLVAMVVPSLRRGRERVVEDGEGD